MSDYVVFFKLTTLKFFMLIKQCWYLINIVLLCTCVYAVAPSNDVRRTVTRSLSCQGQDVMDHHSDFCNSGWGDPEEYKGQQTYPPCVSQFQVCLALASSQNHVFMFVCLFFCCCCCKKGFMCHLLQHPTLYRSASTSYRTRGLDNTGGIETGLGMAPPTPAFPISPPTPYGK